MKVEQVFWGTPENWEDYVFSSSFEKWRTHRPTDSTSANDIKIVSYFRLPYPETGEDNYVAFADTLKVGWINTRPMTEDEKTEKELERETEQLFTEHIELGKIRLKLFRDKTIWECETDNHDCFRWAKSTAEKIYKFHLGSEPIITKDNLDEGKTAVTGQLDESVSVLSAEFDVVDSAILAYLRRYEHYPADFEWHILKDGAYVQYVIFPDDTRDRNKGYLGRIELRKTVIGTNIEYSEPYFKEREQTYEEQRAIEQARQEAVKRHKPDNFDSNNPEQYAALDAAVKRDVRYRRAEFDIVEKIYQEQLETHKQYQARRQEIVNGILAWLDTQGVKGGQPDPIRQDIAAGGIWEDKNTIRENPWDKIPDYRWDRTAVKMLWEGHQDPEIARKLNVVSKTVTNRLSALRQQYPDSVPTRDELRRKKSNR